MRIVFLILFITTSSLFAEEIDTLHELISTTKKNLENQQKLLEKVIEFKQTRQAFVENPTSGKLATQLVRLAMHLNLQIENQHLSHLFSSNFLTEVHFFNQVGKEQLSRE